LPAFLHACDNEMLSVTIANEETPFLSGVCRRVYPHRDTFAQSDDDSALTSDAYPSGAVPDLG
jgi:hypothetical protein